MEQPNQIPPNQYQANQGQPATNSNLGLFSLLASTIGFFIIAPVGAVLAIVFAMQAKKNPSASVNDLTMAKIGLILGWVEIAIIALFIVFFLSMITTTN